MSYCTPGVGFDDGSLVRRSAQPLFTSCGIARQHFALDLGTDFEGGDIQIKQSVNLTALGASQGLTSGALLGGLAGLLVLNPLAGFALGGAAGAAAHHNGVKLCF